jgi:hypothetical protein
VTNERVTYASDGSATSLAYVPTSQLFRAVLENVPTEDVTVGWLLRRLGQRSFGMVMLLLGLVAIIPGVSVLAALLLTVLGFQMMMARDAPILPRFIADRSLPARKIARLVNRSLPVMRALERLVRPRWHTPFMATKRVVGLIVLLLAATLFIPIPLSNIIPGALVMLAAFAYLEEDGILLCIALSVSIGSLAITAVEVWATLRGADFLFRL